MGLQRELAGYNGRVRKFYLRVAEVDLTNAVNGGTQDFILGKLPAGAVLLRAPTVKLTTQFTGGGASAVGVTVGTSGAPTLVMTNFDVFGSAASGLAVDGTLGAQRVTPAGGQDIIARFTPNGGASLLNLTAGVVELEVYYALPGQGPN